MAVLSRSVVLILAIAAISAERAVAGEPLVRGLDHVIVVASDLDSAADAFRQLGFMLKPGHRHENGIANQHVKFPDGSEIELLSVSYPSDGLAREYADHIAVGDGPVFAGLFAPSLEAVASALSSAGIDATAGGGLVAFPAGDPCRYLFLGGRNQSPTDRPEHFRHENRSAGVVGVCLAKDEFEVELEILDALSIAVSPASLELPDGAVSGLVAELEEGTVAMVPGSVRAHPDRPIVGVTVRVDDLDPVRRVLDRNEVEYQMSASRARLFVRPPGMPAVWIELSLGEIDREPDR